MDEYLYTFSVFETGLATTAVKQLDVISKKVSKHKTKCYTERKQECSSLFSVSVQREAWFI